ncbi:DUF6286 domain-containing protein [Streptomyces sedi]|uniref:DUF6286 domain-containing protein n=1 Tax=Streptomyces sedi TaxID=555059 RepID=A0A5C4V0Z1_9ACTN|nr:hypothetical protein FH715_14690 [Streptomyces sedi]
MSKTADAPEPGAGPGDETAPEGEESDPMRQSASTARYEPGGAEDGRAPRFWSVRRVPAGLVAAALLAGSGLLLFDIVSVRADRPAAAWRRETADALATRPLDDGWVVAGAALAMLLGVGLVVLACTPGLRRLLPMRQDSELMRAGIERSAAALVLRDRALEVSGVRSVRVAVGRRRIRVTAEAHFRVLDAVRADLDAVLGDGIDELGLARRPALAVQVRRPAKR